MSFTETNYNKPTRHNPYLHQIVINYLKQSKPGKALDIPSGPGYLLKDLQDVGFTGVAAEIDEKLHCLENIDYKKVDMNRSIPICRWRVRYCCFN